ncbi:transcription termination factor Rho [Kitasatospora sp. NPDC058406]|uniref:transcription termination factor Rho n=1 Tax=Kitasatospora sp. NPDC058406 TaxID=3346483 RepID=UPI00364668D4
MTTTTEPSTTTPLDSLLKADLHRLASALSVPGASRLRKGQLVEAITAKRLAGRPTPPTAGPGPRPADTESPGARPALPPQRTRDRAGRPAQPATTAGSGLVPASGVLDIHDGNAVLRTSGYLPGPTDLHVPARQLRALGLRSGDVLTGAARPHSGDRRPLLERIDTVNGRPADNLPPRPAFNDLTPLYPQQHLRLETGPRELIGRVLDLVAPIGKGQRGLIVAPPKAGKTMVVQRIAAAIAHNHPETHLMVVLVDERPEEVTDIRRSVKGEVIASTFDRPAREHIAVAELAVERAKRLVELGHDVVVLLDSVTRLTRAHNAAAPAHGRTLSGGLDATAIQRPKKLFGAARNVENGGSLTILATALVDTGSRMDDLIFEEFKSTGNMELRLDRRLADKRLFPAVDVRASGTRREELLLGHTRTPAARTLRRVLGNLDLQPAAELLLNRLKQTTTNTELLRQVATSAPTPPA